MNEKFETVLKVFSPDNIWAYGLGAMLITAALLAVVYILYVLIVCKGKSPFTRDLFKLISKIANLLVFEFIMTSVMSLVILFSFGLYALFTYIF